MGLSPLISALLLFTLAQMAILAGQVIMFRSDTKALRREVEASRIADKEMTQLKLDALTESVKRVEKQLEDIARNLGGARRASDHHIKE